MGVKSCYCLLFTIFCFSFSNAAVALLAKPAFVPFTQNVGSILVHVDDDFYMQCHHPYVEIKDVKGLLNISKNVGNLSVSHTDRLGLQWLHVRADLTKLPLGVTPVKVTACGDSVITKVAKL